MKKIEITLCFVHIWTNHTKFTNSHTKTNEILEHLYRWNFVKLFVLFRCGPSIRPEILWKSWYVFVRVPMYFRMSLLNYTATENYYTWFAILLNSLSLLQKCNFIILCTYFRWILDSKPKTKSLAITFASNGIMKVYLSSSFYFTAKWADNLFLDRDLGP